MLLRCHKPALGIISRRSAAYRPSWSRRKDNVPDRSHMWSVHELIPRILPSHATIHPAIAHLVSHEKTNAPIFQQFFCFVNGIQITFFVSYYRNNSCFCKSQLPSVPFHQRCCRKRPDFRSQVNWDSCMWRLALLPIPIKPSLTVDIKLPSLIYIVT